MIRVKIELSYDGSDFHGWQIQSNAVSVQGTVKEALRELFGEEVPTAGYSRTDAGVHAKYFVCHADLPRAFPWEKFPLAVNALLPDSIAVLRASPAPEGFHARFSCKGKTYRYRIYNERIRDPFEEKRAYFFPRPLSAEAMHQSAQAFVGEHDFAAFMASGSEVTDTVRTVYAASVERRGSVVEFSVTGNGFLYNMVRIMAGTLISEQMGKLSRSIPEIISLRDRTLAGITVPPQGLYLEKVFY